MSKRNSNRSARDAVQDRIIFLTVNEMSARAKAIMMAPPVDAPDAVIADAAHRALRYVEMASRLRRNHPLQGRV